MCEVVTKAGAEYIKTSTGFSTAGAEVEDVALMRRHIGKDVKIKAAGGIASFADAQEYAAVPPPKMWHPMKHFINLLPQKRCRKAALALIYVCHQLHLID